VKRLDKSFYLRDDVVSISKELLGKYVFTRFDGVLTGGMIVETEAYNGRTDKACHAFLKRTKRTEILYNEGGEAYIYLCYGIHHMLNIVTNEEGLADAILIRAIEPTEGIETMIQRRGGDKGFKLTAGPGSLGQALGIHKDMTGTSLLGDEIWIEQDVSEKSVFEIEVDRRVGVDYAGEDALHPWRFYIKDNKYVSRKKQKPLNVAN